MYLLFYLKIILLLYRKISKNVLQVFIDALCNTFKKSVTAVLRSVTFSVYVHLQSVTTYLIFSL